MVQFLKRLNWTGFFIIMIFSGMCAFSRTPDEPLNESFLVWGIFGIPMSLIFLFIGMKEKNK